MGLDGGGEVVGIFSAESTAPAPLARSSPEDLPTELDRVFDGRMAAGPSATTPVLPEQGVRASSLSDAQRRLLLDLAVNHAGSVNEPHAAFKMHEIARHLDEIWSSWMDDSGESSPLY